MLSEKVGPVSGDSQPGASFLHPIMERGERPHLPRLQPDELVRVKDGARPIQAGEITAIFPVYRVILPERNGILKQTIPIERREFFETSIHTVLS